MKKVLVVGAFTNSEWDSVDVALVNLTDDLIDMVKEVKGIIDGFPKDFDFYSLSKFYADFELMIDNEGGLNDLVSEEFIIGEGFIIGEVDVDVNLDNLSIPENAIDTQQIIFTRDGFSFKAYGKHTSEEFWTNELPYSALNI